MGSNPWVVLRAGIGLIIVSAVAGVLVAASLAPGVAVAGTVSNASISVFESLPDYIHLGQLPQRNRIFANSASGPQQIATVYDQNREEDIWAKVSPNLKNAAVDGEDKNFYSHGGVDVPSLVRAAVGNISSGLIQSGASTIAMQVVRNVEVQQALQLPTQKEQQAAYQAATTDTVARKLKEVRLAIGLEKFYTKQQVLLTYLNIANFGQANYGVEAAAQAYFSTSAADVTPAQAASLVAMLQNPSYLNLGSPTNYAANQGRRNYILGQMYAAKHLTRAQYEQAIKTPVNAANVHLSTPQNGCLSAQVQYQWMCDYVVNNVGGLTSLGTTPGQRLANWKVGGYDVYTTLDMGMQTTATDTLHQLVPNTEQRFQLGGAVTTVQPGTGRILIMAENKDYNNTLAGGGPTTTAVNYNVDQANGGSVGFQPGSAYKLFTLVDWLQHGHTLSESLNASVRSMPASSFTDACTGGRLRGKPYTFQNDANEQGNTTVLRATARSINAVFIQMASKLDLCDIKNVAVSLGVQNANGKPLSDYPSCVIGGCSNALSPLTLAAAYAAVADNGVYCSPVAVDKIVGPSGTQYPGQSAACHQAIAPNIAATAADALQGVMNSGGTAYVANPRDGTPFLGKTGTTNNSVQTWTVASSTKAATAVWIGNISGTQALRSIYVNRIQAAVLRHSVFKTIMTYVDRELGVGAAFPAPDPALVGHGNGFQSGGSGNGSGGGNASPAPTTPPQNQGPPNPHP
jgi:membrane peptidoglycan carboxypeptidase